MLFYILILLLIAITSELVGPDADDALTGVTGIFFPAMFIPAAAVLVRRLHDVGRSGWWILVGFVPLIGDVVLLIFALLPSQPGQNRYGPSPLEV